MSGRDENRVFVGGLAWETNDRQLQDAFSRYGKILECVVVADRDTGRSRGFGFVTFVDHRAMDDAISDMHGRELDGRIISVNKAKPKLGGGGGGGGDEDGFDHGRDYISGGGGGGRRGGGGGGGGGGDRSATTDCFKCGRPGHFARECPLSDGGGGGGGGGRFSSQFGRSRVDPYDDRTGRGGRYGDRDQREYGGGRDGGRYDPSYSSERYNGGGGGGRYGPGRESYGSERYELQGEYGRDRGYLRDVGPRAGVDRYGSGGPDRYERGSYKDRAVGPYDRHRRGDRISPPYERY